MKLPQIIDTDIHPMPKSEDEIKSYIPMPYRRRYTFDSYKYYSQPVQESRLDVKISGNDWIASNPDIVMEEHMDRYNVEYGILLPRAFVSSNPFIDMANNICIGFNDWLMDKWLEKNNKQGRFKGSILVNPQDPIAAAKEIERCANHPHMVQVMVDSGSRAPFGHRQFYPIYEMCEKYDLPFALHPGTDGVGINDSNTLGYPASFIEYHTLLCTGYMSHLVSFITEGVFERFPRLKVVLVEGGVSWIPPVLWRLDAEYKALREEVPWMKKRPFEYFTENVRVTTQPLEVPDNKQHMWTMLEALDAQNTLMFSSDYSHWDFDAPDYIMRSIPKHLIDPVFSETARRLYKLPNKDLNLEGEKSETLQSL
ncbi:amidohydrolase [Lysinibacillus macroides]|uniref:Amidohydrolase-related domain-containing protein n=1 Tax=Lysinibacillus macroides TaxID=33935 RepID=A0A0M9DJD1_9BACI|nr:amidohydrolase family protein [Lysinibacillus macroides]KOY81382.1 hypothetical protein ADM90_19880 [Lysinibacillus macroides]QPR68443.1 amidohydrolase [Lysinibacillus macroides]